MDKIPSGSIEPEGRFDSYEDTGCHLHPSCLKCPRPICIYDEPKSRRNETNRAVSTGAFNRMKVKAMLMDGITNANVIAETLGMSRRTVYNHLRRLKREV